MKTKKIVCLLACVFAAVSAFAKPNLENIKTLVTKYSKSNVVLVGRIVGSGIDTEGRLAPFSFGAVGDTEVHLGKYINTGDDELPKVTYMMKFKDSAFTMTFNLNPNGEYFFTPVSPDKNEVELEEIEFHLFPKLSYWFAWSVGPEATITYPEEAEFVYVGTFVYTFDYALNMTKFQHIDEYDETQKMLSEAMGEEIKLYRAEINIKESK